MVAVFALDFSASPAADCSAAIDGLKEANAQLANLNQRLSAIKAMPNPDFHDAELCTIVTKMKNAVVKVENAADPSCEDMKGVDIPAFKKKWDDVIAATAALQSTACGQQ